MRFRSRGRVLRTSLVLLTVVSMLGVTLAGVAETDVTYAAGSDPGRTDYSVSGDQIVWLETDSAGVKQVHTLNQTKGTSQTLTSSSSAKDAPAVGGGIVVWADKGSEEESSLNWDIYSANASSGTRAKLNQTSGQYGNPSTDGVGVVWYERKHYGNMIYHDLASGVEADLGEGRFPVLANGIVVYKNARNGGLSMLDLSNGATRSLVSLGGANFVDWFVFNGTQVLWKQKNGASESKYVLMSIEDFTKSPIDLTPMSAAGTDYAFMSMGADQAVFQVDEKGVSVLKKVNLSSQEVTTLPSLPTGAKLIGISGEKLLYSIDDQYIETVQIGAEGETNPTPTPTPTPAPGSNSGAGPGSNIVVPVVIGPKDSLVIGDKGGTLSAANGMARLEVSAGTFPENTTISLAQVEDSKTLIFKDNKGVKLRKASSSWQVEATATFKLPALLAIGYSKEDPWTTNREKLGIYRYDSAIDTWSYCGGVTNLEDGYVRNSISESGIYAVMLRETGFSDMTAHWARHEVEVLSARGIVDGMNSTQFAPKGTLTRAQFTKLLAAALQLKPILPAVPTFRDVSANHWSYGWVEAAAAAGIVTGDAGYFRGNDPLTREQMMVMLIRVVNKHTEVSSDSSVINDIEAELAPFKDSDDISSWAKNAVATAIHMKLVQGNGQYLYPEHSSTRAEAAIVVYKLLAELGLL